MKGRSGDTALSKKMVELRPTVVSLTGHGSRRAKLVISSISTAAGPTFGVRILDGSPFFVRVMCSSL